MKTAPNYRWQCHRCASTNPPEAEHCLQCGFSAIATGYKILGQENPLTKPISESGQSVMEQLVRVIHILIGCLFLGVMVWALLIAPVFNPWVFWGGLTLGALALSVGIFGSRKAVLQVLFWGWI